MRFADYVADKAKGKDQVRLADLLGVSQSTISRWKDREDPPSIEVLIAFARAVDESPVAALVEFGYLRKSDLPKVVEIERSLADVDTEDLVIELGRRLNVRLVREGRRGA
jgi:transcriptional regulator with XRE-family HTH domain